MGYRKITVNDTVYKFVVGKTHTKIVDVGVYVNEEIGYKLDEELHQGRLVVKPHKVRQLIEDHLAKQDVSK